MFSILSNSPNPVYYISSEKLDMSSLQEVQARSPNKKSNQEPPVFRQQEIVQLLFIKHNICTPKNCWKIIWSNRSFINKRRKNILLIIRQAFSKIDNFHKKRVIKTNKKPILCQTIAKTIRNVSVATDEGPSPKLAPSEGGSRGNIES